MFLVFPGVVVAVGRTASQFSFIKTANGLRSFNTRDSSSLKLPEPSPLLKIMTARFEQQKLSQVLDVLSAKGGFIFSYNGKALNPDSLVTLNADHLPVWKILDQLFKGQADYKVHENYIILRLAFMKLAIYPEEITASDQSYIISGFVKDENTGNIVKQASVYDKKLLQSALTDDKGYFRIRFKGKHDFVLLTASKELYRDTMMIFLQDIKIAPSGYSPKPEEKVTAAGYILRKSGISSFLISSKQRIQNMNIPDFLAYTPLQVSLTPGLSSHGAMSAQVINKFSYNLIGGYTAGVSGLEVAGLFNFNRGDVSYVQVAGVFNRTEGSVRGIQVAGIANVVGQHAEAVQVSGVVNIVKENFKGIQVSGITNIVSDTLRGLQVSAIFNYAKTNRGFQLALINKADSSSGVSLGLLNLIHNGYHQLSIYSNELIHTGLSVKTGTAKLYSVFSAGTRLSGSDKLYAIGLGVGHDFVFTPHFALSAEYSKYYIINGYGFHNDVLRRFQTNFQWRIAKQFAVFAGPSYSFYRENEAPGKAGYHSQVAPDYARTISSSGLKGWLGWNAGIILF